MRGRANLLGVSTGVTPPCGVIPDSRLAVVSCRSRCSARHSFHRKVFVQAEATQEAETAVKDPFEEEEVYNDSFLDKLCLRFFTDRMSEQIGKPYEKDIDYDSFVRVSREVISGRTTGEVQLIIANVFSSVFPPGATARFRSWFKPNRFSCEFNALITKYFFPWLVGPCEIKDVEIQVSDDQVETWQSAVQIKKCRYLEQSKCVAMCTNMCKLPTQSLFTDKLGLPVTMKPNFEDLSCEMIFGQKPPPFEEDEVYNQPCFVNHCAIARQPEKMPCHRLDTDRTP